MIIASWDQLIGYDGMSFQPFTRYVVTEATFERVTNSVVKAGGQVINNSSFNNSKKMTRKHVPKRRIAVYRHTAYGDQLIMTGFCAYLKHLWPDCRIFYYCSPEIADIWRWNPHIEFCGGPLPIETANHMNDHIFFEQMFECDSESDQQNCYDNMFHFAGFDPADVPDKFKIPHLYFNQDEQRTQRILKERYGSFVIYHWSSSNRNRMYPPEQAFATLQWLSAKLPDHKIIVLGTDHTKVDALNNISRVEDLRNRTRTFRDVLHFVSQADLVIGPDSSVMHAAAAIPIPCISLWGLFHPDDRIKYYPMSYPLTGFSACPHAPCRNHDFKLPVRLCRDAENHIEPPEFCNALREIAPLQIAQLAYDILIKNERRISTPTTPYNPLQIEPTSGGTEVPAHSGTEVGEDNILRGLSGNVAAGL